MEAEGVVLDMPYSEVFCNEFEFMLPRMRLNFHLRIKIDAQLKTSFD